MNNAKMVYFEKEDILHLALSDEQEAGSLEISPNITVELNQMGDLIGIELSKNSKLKCRLDKSYSPLASFNLSFL